MNLQDLAKPFPAADIEWRLQQTGTKKDGSLWAKCLAYITSRAVMDRLDDVCGPGNWKNEFRHVGESAVLCGISIRMLDFADASGLSEWVTKWDGAENTDVEAVKGGLSAAMKRAAVQWGIGRYLYDLEEGFAKIHDKGAYYAGKNDKKGTPAFHWDPPTLPAWALPAGEARQTRTVTTSEASVRGQSITGDFEDDYAATQPKPATKKPADLIMPAGAPVLATIGKRLGDCSVQQLNETAAWCKKPDNKGKAALQSLLKAVQLVATEKALGPEMIHENDNPFPEDAP